jgi:hypothetical protein
MKKTDFVFSVFTCIILIASSCKKEKAEDLCVGGASGNLNIKVYLQHHEHTLVNLKTYRDTIYVKYKVQEFPGTDPAAYDAIYIGEYQENYVMLTNLKCGNYFLYAVGMESTHYVRVFGGIPFSTAQMEGEIIVTIPVSE